MAGLDADQLLADKMATFRCSKTGPLDYVMFNFPWSEDPSIQHVPLAEPWKSRYNCQYGPDQWACQFLDQWGEEIVKRGFTGHKAVAPIRFSTSSGHGIGKSTIVAWIIMYIMDTRPWSMGMVTATTADQLRTKTWAELAKWHHMAKTTHLWVYSNSRGNMALARRGSDAVKNKWRCDALTARAENSEAFQGLHSASGTPFYIFDEASGVDDAIWEARFGGATDGEPMSFDFGNPTRKSGYFYENTVGAYRHRYITRLIDSRDVYITNKALMKEWEDDWGVDSDMFKVKVRGMFPAQGSMQFISSEDVDDAMKRPGQNGQFDPLIIGCDVARFGHNETIIFPRIGNDCKSFPYRRYNGLDATQVVDKIIATLQEFSNLGRQCDGLYVDGGGLGSGIVDMLRRLGYNPVDVNFGGSASDTRYRRRGDEMWGRMKDQMPRLMLPQDLELKKQLTQREYDVAAQSGKIFMEPKELMRERLGSGTGCDIADALALTFASSPASSFAAGFQDQMASSRIISDYDPLEM